MSLNADDTFSSQLLTTARTTYLDFIIDEYSSLERPSSGPAAHAMTLPLDAVYVSPRLKPHQKQTRKILFPYPCETGQEDLPEGLPEILNAQKRREVTQNDVGLPQALTDHARLLLLGKLGAGKTTVTRFLALRFACALRDGQARVRDGEGHDYGEARLPIRVHLADYANALHNNGRLALRSFLVHSSLPPHLPSEQQRTLFEDALHTGQAFVLLDGLDEVAETSLRTSVVAAVQTFLNALEPGNRVLITSRRAEQELARRKVELTVLTIQDMDREQRTQFLSRWFMAVECFHDAHADEAAREQRASQNTDAVLSVLEASEGAPCLVCHPRLLTRVAELFHQNMRLPRQSIELYSLLAQSLLREWQLMDGGLELRTLDEAEARELLGLLAYELHRTEPSGLISEDRVTRLLCHAVALMRGRTPDDGDVQAAIADFLRRVREHPGLFIEHAPGKYGFLHPTFEAYFAAQEIVRDTTQAAQRLRDCRHQARWEAVLRFALASQSPPSAAFLVRAALWRKDGRTRNTGYQPSAYESVLRRDLLLAACCLSDCAAVEEELAHELAGELVAICFNRRSKGKYARLRDLAQSALIRMSRCKAVAAQIQTMLLPLLDAPQTFVRGQVLSLLEQTDNASDALVPVLQAWLHDSDRDIRSWAAAALATFAPHSAQALPALLHALRDPESEVRSPAAEALGEVELRSDEIRHALVQALQDPDDLVRGAAAQALAKQGHNAEEVLAALLQTLTEPGKNITAVVRALGTVGRGSEAALNALLRLLHDPDSEIRLWAVGSLGEWGQTSEEMLTALLPTLHDPDGTVRWWAMDALGKLGQNSPRVIAALIHTLQEEEAYVRALAAKALGGTKQGSAEVLHALQSLLQDADYDVRSRAVEALGLVGQSSRDAIPVLLQAFQDKEGFVRLGAALGLGLVGATSGEALHALLQALRDEDAYVRAMAVKALSVVGRGSQEALAALENLLSDAELGVRIAVVLSLGIAARRYEDVLPALLRALDEEDSLVSPVAAHMLVAAGQCLDRVLPVLQTWLRSPSSYLHEDAATVLSDLQPGSETERQVSLQTVQEQLYSALLQEKDRYTRDSLWTALNHVAQAEGKSA